MSSSVSSSYVGGGGDNPPPQAQSKAKKDQLRQALMPSFEKLYRLVPESLPFRQPVDPQVLGIPNYFNIVKKPMDLSTIKRKLDAGEYRTPLEYCHDVWLMFDNAWLYNKKTSCVYKDCTTLSEVFAKIIQPVVESHSYRHGFNLDDGSLPANLQKARKLSIQRCIQSLVHACQCRETTCRLPSCGKLKRVVTHTKVCKSRTNGGCPICKQLIALCCYHAKHCQETKCLVPFCSNIKHKLKQQELQQAQLLRRRMAAMNGRQTGAQVNAIQGSQPTPTTPIPQQQQQPPAPPPQAQQSIPMSGGGGPGVGPPNANVNMQSKQSLQQLLQVLRSPSTPEQQSQILQILKSNPPLMVAFIKQRQQQIGQQHAEAVNQMDPSQQWSTTATSTNSCNEWTSN